jgi:hypothetical protein
MAKACNFTMMSQNSKRTETETIFLTTSIRSARVVNALGSFLRSPYPPQKVCLRLAEDCCWQEYMDFFMQYRRLHPDRSFDLEVEGIPYYTRQYYTRGPYYAETGALARVLKEIGKNQLRSLTFKNLGFAGNLTPLVHIITTNHATSLEEFRCWSFFNSDTQRDPGISAASFTALRKVTFSWWYQTPDEAMLMLAEHPTVEDMTLIAPPADRLSELFDTLRRSSNTLSLKKLVIQKTQVNHLKPLASFLKHNATLEELDIAINPLGGSLGLLTRALDINDTLHKLRIRGRSFWPHDTGFFLVLLEDWNYTLGNLDVSFRNYRWRGLQRRYKIKAAELEFDRLKFLLKLNQYNRKKLLQYCWPPSSSQSPPPPSTQEWIDTIISTKDDPSITFYYLIRNPSLLCGCRSSRDDHH